MKSKNEIYIDFKRARKAVNELEEVANLLSKIANTELNKTKNQLSTSWKCTGADVFQTKEERLQAMISASERTVRSIAEQIKRDAERMYEAEKRAYEIASKRTS